jgi:hypothetical protein
MYFKIYDYISGDLINQVSTFDFGDIIQNQHTVKPIVIRAFSNENITNFKVYLEDKGTWKDTEYGYYVSSTFEPSIESGSTKLSNHFIEVPNATISSLNGITIGWDTTSSYYLWIDSQITDRSGIDAANFRFFYTYI